MKAIVTKLKIVGEKEGVSEVKYGHFKTVRESFIDDSYTDGVDKYKILYLKKGKSRGIDTLTWHIADNGDVNVLPCGIAYSGSVGRYVYDKDYYKVLPAPKEIQPTPQVNWITLMVEGSTTSGEVVDFPFEHDDIQKPIFLGKNGDITVDKPTSSEYNTPIGFISDLDTICLDFGNIFPKHQTPVTKH